MRSLDVFGADYNSPLLSAIASYSGPYRRDLVQLLLQHGAKVDTRTTRGMTTLHEAIARQDQSIVKLLIDHSADLEATLPERSRWCEGGTALHIAVGIANFDLANLLLTSGANPTATSTHGWTPLDIALLDRQQYIADLLLSYTNVLAYKLAEEEYSVLKNGKYDSKIISDMALHLLTRGVVWTSISHRELYLHCMATLLRKYNSKRERSIKIKDLINDLEGMLMALAGRVNDLSICRDLCMQCYIFQNQDAKTMYEPFNHSSDISVVHLSAREGCDLCGLVLRALERQHSRELDLFRNKAGPESPTVLLKIEGKDLYVGHAGKTAMAELNFIDGKYGYNHEYTTVCITSFKIHIFQKHHFFTNHPFFKKLNLKELLYYKLYNNKY
jgi:hypothetical protein